MKIKFYVLFIFCIGAFVRCNKDKLPNDTCEDIPPPTGNTVWGYQWTKQLPYYDLPCFNPNNPDEIIVRGYKEFGDTTFQLLKYNLSTEEKQVIYEGNFAIRPRWSRKDWILLNLRDFNIYKIKSNGDSLTQLTTVGSCLGGEWNYSGDMFMYKLIGTPSLRVICDDIGNPIDTIESAAIAPSWQHDSLVAVANHSGVAISKYDLNEYDYITYENRSIPTWTSAEWLDNENVIWANRNGIFSANITEKVANHIKESCDAKVYTYPTVSFVSQKVIFQRDDREVTGTNEGTSQSRLFIMNFDGSNEMEIEIPN